MLLRNFPFVGEVRLTELTRYRERALRSYRTIGRLWYQHKYTGVRCSDESTTTLCAACLCGQPCSHGAGKVAQGPLSLSISNSMQHISQAVF